MPSSKVGSSTRSSRRCKLPKTDGGCWKLSLPEWMVMRFRELPIPGEFAPSSCAEPRTSVACSRGGSRKRDASCRRCSRNGLSSHRSTTTQRAGISSWERDRTEKPYSAIPVPPVMVAPYLKALRRSTAGPGHGSPTAFFVVAADSPRHSSPGINPFRRSHIFAVVSGMMVVSEDVAINGRASRSSWGHSRLSPLDETAGALGFPIGLLFAEHPIRRFGEMPGHGSDRLRVALPPGNALIETTHVAVARAPAVETDCVRGFDERPLEVAVDIGSRRSETGLPSARVNARCGTRIGSQLLGAGKPRDIAHTKGDYDGEREPHARQGQEPLNRRCRLEGGLNPLFERTHLAAQLLDLPDQLLAGVRRVRREELKSLPQKRAAPDAEKIAHL